MSSRHALFGDEMVSACCADDVVQMCVPNDEGFTTWYQCLHCATTCRVVYLRDALRKLVGQMTVQHRHLISKEE